ncbi:MAG: fimbria major subunit [Prevotella sp.]|nr:fimbria major subunit [Prevotella sp.]
MKKFSFLALAAAGLLFGACASNDAVDEQTQNAEEVRSEGYVAVNINLPVSPVSVTRTLNDQFDDGDANEYAVHDCAILFFQGADEASATLMNAQPILLPFDKEVDDAEGSLPDADNITTSYQATAKVSGFTTGNNLYALAMLNYKNVMTINTSTGLPTINKGNSDPTGTSPTVTLTGSSTLSDLVALTTDIDLIHNGGPANYFFMTNAILSSDEGGVASAAPASSNLFQLAYMDPTKIKETKEEARANVAGEIFVERAVAKATLRVTASTIDAVPGASFTVDGWTLDNMEPASFIAKNRGDFNDAEIGDYIPYSNVAFTTANYRMIGNTSVTVDKVGKTNTLLPTTTGYRSYWCVDPQYKTDAAGMLAGTDYVSAGEAQYCYENTFNVAHQNYKNTTRAIFKVTLSSTADFYTVNESQTMFSQADAETYAIANIVNNTEVVAALKAALNPGKSCSIDRTFFNVTFERDALTGKYIVKTLALSTVVTGDAGTGMTFKSDVATSSAMVSALANAIDTANDAVVIRKYVNGEMWYEARIQHFASSTAAEDLAPWNSTEVSVGHAIKPTGGNTAGSYPGTFAVSENNYLGRYGMVRNNWYDIEVTAIKKLGKPVDPKGLINNPDIDYPDTPDTPDDDLSQYISAKIHVLSWAKRTQKWSL